MELKILSTLGIVFLITVLYKLLPFRKAEGKKPSLAFFPKYKKRIKHSLSRSELEEKLSSFGFKKVKDEKTLIKFARGSVLGDISIKLAKINVALKEISEHEHEITIQAGWIAAIDTGDHWQFINELSNKIEST